MVEWCKSLEMVSTWLWLLFFFLTLGMLFSYRCFGKFYHLGPVIIYQAKRYLDTFSFLKHDIYLFVIGWIGIS